MRRNSETARRDRQAAGRRAQAKLLLGLVAVFAVGVLASGALGDVGIGGSTGSTTDTTATTTADAATTSAAVTTTDSATTTATAPATTDAATTTTAPSTTDAMTTTTTATTTASTLTTTTSTAPAAALTLSSDKTTYTAGDTVTLTGSGFTTGETVSMHVADTGASAWTYDGTAPVATNGTFITSFALPSLFASTFTATATGAPGESASASVSDTLNPFSFSPSIKSDQADYAPGSPVPLSGSGWPANDSLTVKTDDNVGNTWSDTGHPKTNADGEFTYTLTLPNWFVASYTTTAKDANGLSATTSFTDGNLTIRLATAD